jgi:two-component system nitrogen regulation response regulator GlnG
VEELASENPELIKRAGFEMESVLMDLALQQTGGQRNKAAELLGLGRNTLTRKLKQHPELSDPSGNGSD